jgi:hypothetical protein
MSRMGFPEFDVPAPYRPVTGGFAISLRVQRFGDLFHTTYPPDALAWLGGYQPGCEGRKQDSAVLHTGKRYAHPAGWRNLIRVWRPRPP